MAESTTPTSQFLVSSKESTEQWLTENGMTFNVSLPYSKPIIYADRQPHSRHHHRVYA
jgi:hypothetical protein